MSLENYPDFSYEKSVWKKGYKMVAGCDEVGRGCLAGPVVCGAVVFTPTIVSTLHGLPLKGVKVNDSKKLSGKQREISAKWIKQNALTYGIGVGSVAEINKYGIVGATQKAFRRAVAKANKKLQFKNKKSIEFLLLDAFYLPYTRGLAMPSKSVRSRNKDSINKVVTGGQMAIVNGDEKSITIAAASIIAKVYRDKLMTKLSQGPKYKKYGWEKNKGYGTKTHLKALQKYGVTKHHRNLFVRKSISKT